MLDVALCGDFFGEDVPDFEGFFLSADSLELGMRCILPLQ